MDRADREGAGARLRLALDLSEFGLQVMWQNLRRRHPHAPEEEIDRLFVEWLHQRPGAEHGDGAGRLVPWPRPAR